MLLREFLMASALIVWLALASASSASEPSRSLDDAWIGLLDRDDGPLSRDVLTFFTRPDEAVPFLDARLEPLRLNVAEALAIARRLGSPDERVWRPAYERASTLDLSLAGPLEALLGQIDDPVALARVAAAENHEPSPDAYLAQRIAWLPEARGLELVIGNRSKGIVPDTKHIFLYGHRPWMRIALSLSILHHLDRPDARRIVARMAEGNPDAVPTQNAQRMMVVATQPTTQSAAERAAAAWDHLGDYQTDGADALLMLAGLPDETIQRCETQLQPLRLSDDDADALLQALASEDRTLWLTADQTMRYYDPRLAHSLSDLMERAQDDLRLRQRLIAVLSDQPMGQFDNVDPWYRREIENFDCGNAGFRFAEDSIGELGRRMISQKKSWTRAYRAILLLESFHRDDATQIIERMTDGNPKAWPTVAAKQARERIR